MTRKLKQRYSVSGWILFLALVLTIVSYSLAYKKLYDLTALSQTNARTLEEYETRLTQCGLTEEDFIDMARLLSDRWMLVPPFWVVLSGPDYSILASLLFCLIVLALVTRILRSGAPPVDRA